MTKTSEKRKEMSKCIMRHVQRLVFEARTGNTGLRLVEAFGYPLSSEKTTSVVFQCVQMDSVQGRKKLTNSNSAHLKTNNLCRSRQTNKQTNHHYVNEHK